MTRMSTTRGFPVETPMHFELAINLKVARTLGVAIPSELQARADYVVE